MGSQKFFQFILLLGTSLCAAGIFLTLTKPLPSSNSVIAQNVNEYLGPDGTAPTSKELIRVQILINDDPSPQGVQIQSVEFNGKSITLKPRDIYGFRGQASFQMAPGKYMLNWTVQRDKYVWPRTVSHEEEVLLDPRDLWIQITIVGDNASIS